MNLRWHVLTIVLAFAAVHLPAIAATHTCGAPQVTDDGWRTEPDPHRAGFDADLLCDAVQTFAQGSSNRHSLLVERHGTLVVDAYRTGSDRSTYSLWASRTEREAAKAMINDARQALPGDELITITLGADKGYDAKEFIEALQ